MSDKLTIYISGPMTGYPEHNFPAFFRAEKHLQTQLAPGAKILNPARNFDGATDRALEDYMNLDIRYVLEADWVVLIDGWENSTGANLEAWIAWVTGKKVYKLHDDESVRLHIVEMPVEKPVPFAPQLDVSTNGETVLQEAERLVNGPRQHSYGHPADDFSKTARIWEVIFGMQPGDITPEQVALAMVGVKISRQLNRPKRDNLVDMAGYTGTIELIHQRLKEMENTV